MKIRVNLIQEPEIRSNSAVSIKFLMKMGAGLAILMVVGGGGLFFYKARVESERAKNTKARWEETEDRYEYAVAVKDSLDQHRLIMDELTGWRESIIHWDAPMSELQRMVPGSVQLTKLKFLGVHELVSTGDEKKPVKQVRNYSMQLTGAVLGENGDRVVLDFVRELPEGEVFEPLIENVNLHKMQRSPTSKQDEELRLFAIQGTFFERAME
jgi:hypothetical protein